MKKILLTTTALVMTAGVAAADVTFSGSAELTYGNWNTEGAGAEGWVATTDLGVSMSGEASGVAYTAGLTVDESDAAEAENIAGAITLSASGLSLSYEDGGELDSGEANDELGDLKIAYAGSGVSVAYVERCKRREQNRPWLHHGRFLSDLFNQLNRQNKRWLTG